MVGQNSGEKKKVCPLSHIESEQRLDVGGKTEMFTASVMWTFREKSTESKGLSYMITLDSHRIH